MTSESILFLNWSASLGGAEMSLLRILNKLDRNRFHPHLWLMQKGPLETMAEQRGIHVEVTPYSHFRSAVLNPWMHVKLLRYLERHQIKLIVAIGALSFILSKYAATQKSIPMLWWMMDIPDGTDPWVNFAGQFQANLLLGCSNAVCKGFEAMFPHNPTPKKAMYLPLEEGLNCSQETLIKLRRELSWDPESKIIGLFGRLQRWKGQKTLLESAPLILKSCPKTVFIFAGGVLPGMDDGYADELKQKAIDLKIDSQVKFLGNRSDVHELMSLCDIVVHTSLKPEPFGLVIAEAMAAGKAVIASKAGGPLEMIQDQENGLLIPPGNSKLLAEAITKLLENDSFRLRLGKQAQESSKTRFSSTLITTQFENEFKELLRQ